MTPNDENEIVQVCTILRHLVESLSLLRNKARKDQEETVDGTQSEGPLRTPPPIGGDFDVAIMCAIAAAESFPNPLELGSWARFPGAAAHFSGVVAPILTRLFALILVTTWCGVWTQRRVRDAALLTISCFRKNHNRSHRRVVLNEYFSVLKDKAYLAKGHFILHGFV